MKYILLTLNGLMLILAIKWYFKNHEDEPLIAIIGQIITLIVVIFEKKISIVKNIKNENTEIVSDIASESDVEITNKKNKDSNIKTIFRK